MSEELNVKVGDKLLYRSGYIHDCIEKIVTVTKVTPTGRIRIDYCNKQFNKYGYEMGSKDSWKPSARICMITDEDCKRIEEDNIKLKALSLIEKLNKKSITYEQAVKNN